MPFLIALASCLYCYFMLKKARELLLLPILVGLEIDSEPWEERATAELACASCVLLSGFIPTVDVPFLD